MTLPSVTYAIFERWAMHLRVVSNEEESLAPRTLNQKLESLDPRLQA